MWRQQHQTYSLEGNPYPPIFAAILVHLMLAALIIILPAKSIERGGEEVVAINLSAMPAPAGARAPSAPPPKAETKPQPPPKAEPKPQPPPKPEPKPQPPPKPEPKPQPPPEPTKIEAKPVKEKPAPQVVEEPPPPKVVSLKPRQLVKKVQPEPPPKETVPKKDTKAVKREMDKIREQLAQEAKALDQRKQNEAEAKAADAEAAQLRRQLEDLQAQSRIMAAREQGLLGSGPATKDNAAASGVNSALAQQYYARITGQLQSYWKLPDFKDWPPNMLATVWVTIDKNGKILDVRFEKRSGDSTFDRLVRKTLDDADPLPPIPPALKKERLEFGVNFTPGSITGR